MLILDENYRVTVDSSHQNYILEKLSEIKDRESGESKFEFKQIGFHGLSLRSVLNQYNNQLLVDEIASTNVEANQLSIKLDELKRHIDSIVAVYKTTKIEDTDE